MSQSVQPFQMFKTLFCPSFYQHTRNRKSNLWFYLAILETVTIRVFLDFLETEKLRIFLDILEAKKIRMFLDILDMGQI